MFLSSANFQNIKLNCLRMHYYPFLLSTFSQQFQLPKHRFNYIRKHRLAFKASLFLNFSQHFQTTRPSFQKPLKCTNKCPCFQHLISSSKSSFQIASEGSVSHLGVNFFFGSSNFQNIVVVFFKNKFRNVFGSLDSTLSLCFPMFSVTPRNIVHIYVY